MPPNLTSLRSILTSFHLPLVLPSGFFLPALLTKQCIYFGCAIKRLTDIYNSVLWLSQRVVFLRHVILSMLYVTVSFSFKERLSLFWQLSLLVKSKFYSNVLSRLRRMYCVWG